MGKLQGLKDSKEIEFPILKGNGGGRDEWQD